MPTVANSNRNARARRVSTKPKKMVTHHWSQDVKTFCNLFGVIMRQTGAPRCAQRKYLLYMRKQLVFQGSGYLAKTRNYPVFGLRILGGDFQGDRGTETFFQHERLRPNADGVKLPVFMSWYWNRLYQLSKVVNPTKTEATEVSRILAVLSFSKFILKDSKRSRQSASRKYNEKVKSMQGLLKNEMVLPVESDESKRMYEFLKSYGFRHRGEEMRFDRRCYSLKSLINTKPHRPKVPPAYGQLHSTSSIAMFGSDSGDSVRSPNRLVNVIQRYYYDPSPYDGALHVICEAGGKYRGICPYKSPYAHSVNLYRNSSIVLRRLPWNCNYDQTAGHKVARRLSRNNLSVVSVDASEFSDSVNPETAALMAYNLGSSGAVHYHGMLRVKLLTGEIIKADVPLMGWKGTFDLASLILAYSFWQKSDKFERSNSAQCGDDFVGPGSLDFWRSVYESYGFKLSENKTVVSKTVSIFCGEYYWQGFEVTPIRFLFTGFEESHRFIGKLIARTRSFIPRCNYSKATKRTVFKFLKNRLGSRYNGYLDFRLSSDLGGIPLDYVNPPPLVPYLETNNLALRCALYNIPFEKDDRQVYSTYFSHLPLGKPYTLYGKELALSPATWPKKAKSRFGRHRAVVDRLISTNALDISSVLLYIYDKTLLKP